MSEDEEFKIKEISDDYDHEAVFLGYLLGRYFSDTKAQNIIDSPDVFDDFVTWPRGAIKDLDKKMAFTDRVVDVIENPEKYE